MKDRDKLKTSRGKLVGSYSDRTLCIKLNVKNVDRSQYLNLIKLCEKLIVVE